MSRYNIVTLHVPRITYFHSPVSNLLGVESFMTHSPPGSPAPDATRRWYASRTYTLPFRKGMLPALQWSAASLTDNPPCS